MNSTSVDVYNTNKRCKRSWRQIRVSFGKIRPLTCVKIKMLCAKKSLTSSIEFYNQISEQDQTLLSANIEL